MTPSELEKAILLTVSYSNVFDFPLKKEEIFLRLVGKKPVSVQKIEKYLNKLTKKKLLFEESGFYFLKNSKKTIFLRKKREKVALKKRNEARKFVDFGQKISFIKAIIITGSLSTNNTDLNDDIDWLIIVAKDRLWIVRPLVLLISALFGKRRQRNGNHTDNSWCFNMFLEESSLKLPPNKRSTYTAYEICQADFVFDRSGVEKQFLKKNKWVNKYLANFYKKRTRKASGVVSKPTNKNMNRRVLFDFLIGGLNKMFYTAQYQYMKKNITNEVVAPKFVFFHPRDTKGKIMRKWRKIVQGVFYE